MQKYFTLLLALWLTVGSSCAVKAEVLHFMAKDSPIEITKHAEKSGKVNLNQAEETSCTESVQDISKTLMMPASFIQTPDFPGLLLSLVTAVFLSLILYEKLKKPSNQHHTYSNLYSPPLYLKFQRLQLYA